MRSPNTLRSLSKSLLCFQLFTLPAFARSPAQEMADAANNFIAALTPEQRGRAVFDFKDQERFGLRPSGCWPMRCSAPASASAAT